MALTKEETAAIRKLKNLAKAWPEDLWIFAVNGKLMVMKLGEDTHERLMTPEGGVDKIGMVSSIDIPADGGDW